MKQLQDIATAYKPTCENDGIDVSQFFEDLPVPAWIYDSTTLRFLAVNAAAISVYGYSREAFLSMTIKDIRPSEDISRLMAAANGRLYMKGAKQSVWRHKLKDGQIMDVKISSSITDDGNVAVVVNDITENVIVQHQRDKLLHLLQQRKHDLDTTLFAINEVAWAMRTDTHELLYTNEATKTVYGYSPEEMMADKNIFFNSIHEDDRAVFYASMQQALTEGRSSASFRVYHRDGTIRYLVGSAFLKKAPGLPYDTLSGFTSDVTGERLLQDQLLNQERKLRSMINNTNDLIWSMDLNLEVVECNQAFRKRVALMTGKKLADVQDTDFGPGTFDHWKQLFYRVLAGETVKTVYESAISGETVFEETVLNPVMDKDDLIVGISCLTRDVTERNKYIQEIETRNKLLQDIAWIQSHKVRSHVATLLGLHPLLDCEHPENPNNHVVINGFATELAALDIVIKEINSIAYSM